MIGHRSASIVILHAVKVETFADLFTLLLKILVPLQCAGVRFCGLLLTLDGLWTDYLRRLRLRRLHLIALIKVLVEPLIVLQFVVVVLVVGRLEGFKVSDEWLRDLAFVAH